VEQIQAKIAARLEMYRLERQIADLEAALQCQDQPLPERADSGEEGQPGEASVGATSATNAPLPAPLVSLQVAEEQLSQWYADVAAQQREMMRVKTQYQAVTEQLQQCRIGRGDWGALMREQRFLAREVEEQKAELMRYEHFVALIEQGATKEEACKQLLAERTPEVSVSEETSAEPAPGETPFEDLASPVPVEPAPRLEGQPLRQALFTTLARMFTNGDPRHIDLERGKFNRAIKNLVAVDVQPEDLPGLRAAFEKRWPRATCTALGLANNLTILLGATRHAN
jgi:hypothetical protein